MATLERIRQRSGLLIIIIGLAMAAFILTDLLGSGNSIFRGDATVVGKINGRNIQVQDFSQRMDTYEKAVRAQSQGQQNLTRKQVADGAWNELLQEEIMGEQYEEMGFAVSSAELYDRLKSNPNVQSAQAFKDQVNGQFSEALFQQYLTNLRDQSGSDQRAAEAYVQWLEFEEGTEKAALSQKYITAVQKGLYMPLKMTEMEYERNNASITAKFLAMEYSTVSDSAVQVTDADYQAYYKEHKEDYKTEDTRSIEFVNFRVDPSQADREAVTEELSGYLKVEVNGTDTIESFATTQKDSLYAANRSDFPVAGMYYRQDDLPAGIDSTIFDHNKGYVVGPYESGNYYKLTRVSDFKNLPDSVSARHILISFNNGQNNVERSYQEAQKLSDSLLTLVKKDSTQFTALAREYSDDPGSKIKGGSLGWFNDRAMVRPFSEFCFHNDEGEIGKVVSQFGFHIIQIMDQKGSSRAVKLINISRELAPSERTYDDIYNEASAFAAEVNGVESFSKIAEEKGYSPRPITRLKAFDESIPGLGPNREIVKWAHDEETKVGDIQLFNNNNSSFVVVIVTDKQEEGYASLESIKEDIKPVVIRRKKAEQFKEKINKARGEGKDIAAIGSELGLQVKDQVTNFNGSAISGYGREPKVIGVMCALEPNKVSEPIEGERGVYVVQVVNRTEASELPDYTSQQNQQNSQVRSSVPGAMFNSLKEGAKIKDRRAKFY